MIEDDAKMEETNNRMNWRRTLALIILLSRLAVDQTLASYTTSTTYVNSDYLIFQTKIGTRIIIKMKILLK